MWLLADVAHMTQNIDSDGNLHTEQIWGARFDNSIEKSWEHGAKEHGNGFQGPFIIHGQGLDISRDDTYTFEQNNIPGETFAGLRNQNPPPINNERSLKTWDGFSR